MRTISVVVACCISVFLGGCGIIEKEINNRGGYLDYIVDEHWIKADSKPTRALRAFAIQASLARLASVSSKSDIDRQLMAIRIGATTEKAKIVLGCAFGETNPIPVPDAALDPCFYFDSAMLDYSVTLFDLAMIALPLEDAKRLINLVPGAISNPVAATEFLGSLLTVAKQALKYGRLVGAIYRDTVELDVQIWLEAPKQYRSAKNAKIPEKYRVTDPMIKSLSDVYYRGNDDMVAWQAELDALRATGLEPIPARKFIAQLAFLTKYLCGLITKDMANGSLQTCTLGLDPLIALGGTPRVADAATARIAARTAFPQNRLVWRYTPKVVR